MFLPAKINIVQSATYFILEFINKNALKLKLSKILCGATFTFVEINYGIAGLAKTGCFNDVKFKRDSIFYPGNIIGADVVDILVSKENDNLAFTIKLAVLNAVSSIINQNFSFNEIFDKDPFELLSFDNKRITIVGAFRSYIKKLHQLNADFKVLELNKNAIDKEYLCYYEPANKYLQEFEKSDIIILTGSTLANRTSDRLLNLLPINAQKIIVGPSAGLVPKILFDNGINIIGATKVIDNQKTYDIIAQGGSAVHLFEQKAAQKICILKNENK